MIVVLAALVLVVTACGDNGDGGDDAAGATPSVATSDAAAATVTVGSSDLGDILVDGEEMTLYVFDNDSEATSACTGGCLSTWPPLVASVVTVADAITGELATFTREDGDSQVMVNGRPLYRYAPDSGPGDTSGQGVGGVWWVVGTDGTAITSTGQDTPTPTTSADRASPFAGYGEPNY